MAAPLPTPAEVRLASSRSDAQMAREPTSGLDFDSIYRRWYGDVLKWCRARGGLDMDLEDLAQEVFVVVQRRVGSFDGENLPGWLYTITDLTVRSYRRRLWFRQLFQRDAAARGRAQGQPENQVERPSAAEADAGIDRADRTRLLERLLGRLSSAQRVAFLLFEIEGYSLEEIAALQRVPAATVATRLFHARKKLARELLRVRRAGSPR